MAASSARDLYFGAYLRVEAPDRKLMSQLAGPDNAVGDIGSIEWDTDSHARQQAWLVNRFGNRIGCLSASDSYKIAVYRAKGWTLSYVLSFVAIDESKGTNEYWAQAAVIAFDPRYEATFGAFLKQFSERAGEGFRPDPELSREAVRTLAADPASFRLTGKVKIPKNGSTTVIVKDHRTPHDRILDQARAGNKGCYAVSWLFIAALIAVAAFIAHTLGVF
ncbi:hypothetical protein [Slackia exigua]